MNIKRTRAAQEMLSKTEPKTEAHEADVKRMGTAKP